jgi:hypothetical protein
VPTTELKEEHQAFLTSPEANSCTRYMNAVPLPRDMYEIGTSEDKMTLTICDTPGFGDSAGVEVDIANGIGMINALMEAKTVRAIVILPYESLIADRMKGTI